VVDQGVAYLSQMLDNQDTFILEYNERLNKNLKRKDIDWSQSRVIFIADSFTRYQQNAVGFKDLPIELWEVKVFEEDLVSYSQLKPLTTKGSIKTLTKDKTIQKISKELIYPLDHHFNRTSPKVKEIFEKIRENVQNLGKVDEVSRKYFIGYWKENVKFLVIHFHKNHLTVWIRIQGYKLNDPKHLTKVLNMKSEYWRKIYKEVRISSISQILDVMYLIKQAYEKAEQRV
jgi:predicted transport protein